MSVAAMPCLSSEVGGPLIQPTATLSTSVHLHIFDDFVIPSYGKIKAVEYIAQAKGTFSVGYFRKESETSYTLTSFTTINTEGAGLARVEISAEQAEDNLAGHTIGIIYASSSSTPVLAMAEEAQHTTYRSVAMYMDDIVHVPASVTVAAEDNTILAPLRVIFDGG